MAPLLLKTDARIIALMAAAAAFALIVFAPAVLGDGDLYWQIAAGRWIIDNHAVLRIDPFSYTRAGHPWQTWDWLSYILMALGYVGLGWSGVMLLFGAAGALTAGLLSWHLSRWLDGAGLLAALVLAFAAAAAGLTAQPLVLALPLFEIWTAALLAAGGRAPSFKLLVLMIAWANLEASFVVGLLFAAAFGLEAVLNRPRDRANVRRWALFAGLAVVAALITPYGIRGLVHAATHALTPGAGWAPLASLVPLALLMAAALSALVVRRAAVKPLRVVLLLWLLLLAATDGRTGVLIAAAAPLVVAEALARAEPRRVVRPGYGLVAALVFAAMIAGLAALRAFTPLDRTEDTATPAAALDSVPAPLARTPVFNDIAFGGYLIFNDVKPFIDSRDGLYGAKFLDRYERMMKPDLALLESTLARQHVRWTILAAGTPAARAMDAMAGWHRLYADRWAAVHVRDDAP